MKQNVLLCIAGLGFAALLLNGCATGPHFDARSSHSLTNFTSMPLTNQFKADWLRASEDYFTLGPGDVVEVEIIGEPASRATVSLGPDGKIYFYLLPGLDVWGLTLPQTRALLERELSKYVGTPEVTVNLKAGISKHVWMLGRLSKPGIYNLGGPMTLLEAIAQAGGTSRSESAITTEELADLRHTFMIRRGQFIPVDFQKLMGEGDMSQNIYLQPDDFIYVPSSMSQEIYVLGAVRSVSALPYKDHLTLVSAIASAHGPIKNAYLSHVAIVRGSLSEPKVAIVDFDAIQKGKAPDVLLEPHDIVYVPLSPYRILYRYLDMIVNSFVGTVAANEGVRAVSPSASPIGVSAPVGGTTSGSGGSSAPPPPASP